MARDPTVRAIAEELSAGAAQEDMQALANRLIQMGCPYPAVVEHCRSAGPHVRGCWVIDLISAAGAEPELGGPIGRLPLTRLQVIREAFAQHLGPKKYRRALRKAVRAVPTPGQVERPLEWDEFVRLRPEYDLPDSELARVFTVCTVHECELEQRTLRGPWDVPELLRDPRFLEARGNRFPHSHPGGDGCGVGAIGMVVPGVPAGPRGVDDGPARVADSPGPTCRASTVDATVTDCVQQAEARMRPQPLIAVRDVEASSRWYQKLLGCQSDHGGTEYERLVADGVLVLQLHSFAVEHHHGPIGDVGDRPYGNGVLLWFEVDDFDEAVARAADLKAEVVLPRHRNPPGGDGGPNHWEIWLRDLDGYGVVLASPDGSAG